MLGRSIRAVGGGHGNLFIGLVMNEYLEDFHRGDFLIRNLLGADPRSGSLVVAALPRLGQTVQFQRRSAAAATEDLNELLGRAKTRLARQTVYGACLCSCNGPGQNLFEKPNHDARMIQERLGPGKEPTVLPASDPPNTPPQVTIQSLRIPGQFWRAPFTQIVEGQKFAGWLGSESLRLPPRLTSMRVEFRGLSTSATYPTRGTGLLFLARSTCLPFRIGLRSGKTL